MTIIELGITFGLISLVSFMVVVINMLLMSKGEISAINMIIHVISGFCLSIFSFLTLVVVVLYIVKNYMWLTMRNRPNWTKGDIIGLLDNNRIISIFEAEHDPRYSVESNTWYYGMRDCREIRLATQEDIDHKIKYQKETVEREQKRLDILLDYRERVDKNATGW